MEINQGEIYLINLGKVVGSEQGGVRPCLILQNCETNKNSPVVLIAPITSQKKSASRFHVTVQLKYTSIVLTEQIRTVDKSRIVKKIADSDMNLVDKVKQTMLSYVI